MSAVAPARRLPEVDDVSRDYGWPSHLKALTRLIGYVAMRRPVWWRRHHFHQAPEGSAEPKWHVFSGRVQGNDPERRWDYAWRALCGYEYVVTEFFEHMPRFGVTTPKRADRCTRCVKLLAEIPASAAGD